MFLQKAGPDLKTAIEEAQTEVKGEVQRRGIGRRRSAGFIQFQRLFSRIDIQVLNGMHGSYGGSFPSFEKKDLDSDDNKVLRAAYDEKITAVRCLPSAIGVPPGG